MAQNEIQEAMLLLNNLLNEGAISQDTMMERQEYLRQNGKLPEAGVGMIITEKSPYKVQQLVPGGPVERTKAVKPGDVLSHVDGVSLDKIRGDKVRHMIIGPVGSAVTMQFTEGVRRSPQGAFLIKVKRAAPQAGGETKCAPDPLTKGTSGNVKYSDDFDITTAERAVKIQYNPRTGEWARSLINVAVNQPFASGAMRTAHHMKDLTQIGDESRYVLKLSKDPNENTQVYFDDVAMQMDAKMYAELYNRNKPPKKVDFLAAHVLQLVEREGEPICGVESYIEGDYKKYNNNWDWSDDQRNTPQAFSHFTWEASNHRLLICDIQGVGDVWTDPQIHTIEGDGYGKGNMGKEGIDKFLASHKCNAICEWLKLPISGKMKQSTVADETMIRPDQGLTALAGTAGAKIQKARVELAGKEAELAKERVALEEQRRQLDVGKAKDLEKARLYFERVNQERERIQKEKEELAKMMNDFDRKKKGARSDDISALVAMGFPRDRAERAVADSQDLEGAVALCVDHSSPPAKQLPAIPQRVAEGVQGLPPFINSGGGGSSGSGAAAAGATASSGTMLNRKVRMQKEVNDCKRMEPGCCYVYAQPIGEGENMLAMWDAVVVGPPDSPYEGGAFELKIQLPVNFPMDSPTITFVTKIFHPNVWCRPDERYGKICLDVIDDKWSPAFSLQKVLLCVQQLLGEPNADAALDPFVADKCKTAPHDFKQLAQEWTKKYALPAASLRSLLEMEFGVARSASALRKMDLSVDRAANYLMEGDSDAGSEPSRANSNVASSSGAAAAAGRQPPPAYAAALPPGWQRHIDPQRNLPYYYNKTTGKSSWDPPV